jgi:hypothetical protein
MGLSLSSAKFATRYLSTCSGWQSILLSCPLPVAPIWGLENPSRGIVRSVVAPARALVCQEVFSRSAFLVFLRFKRARASAVLH